MFSQNQIRDILINADFPEECLLPQMFNYNGPDNKLDVVRKKFNQNFIWAGPMGKPTICIGENKGADQLRGNREADQRLCFRYSDSTIPPLLNSKISSF